ncbi:hypothetical protein BCR32DRAFT_264182 [Anaeromyces robustus]|uniref:Pyrrolo-quinoline quinone repeat domain-containing protein n=1 Tax=Anaeromyces robustus TaxID=1754192 RepID=A0A1Y1XPC7_9FUNG|nr:hypothetical protein BCR32DRAFT_264182 [Anaeromyces robustus]|eukprot:ORX87592.1 hypothetical protein BCR32DRAFT_264182 [Anaeromyces robustus]
MKYEKLNLFYEICWKNKYVYIPIHETYLKDVQNKKYVIIETKKIKQINIKNYKIITCPIFQEYSLLISDLYNARETEYPVEKYDYRYIMHTSGTTRKSNNGITVRVPEHSLYWNIMDIIQKLNLYDQSHYYGILMTSPSFDPSLIEIFISLILGGTLIVPSTSLIKATDFLFHYCLNNSNQNDLFDAKDKIELTLMMTPSHLFSFKESIIRDILIGKTNVRNLILGGEKFPSINKLLDIMKDKNHNDCLYLGISLWNIYGITENSVWATIYKVKFDHFINYINNENKVNEYIQNNRLDSIDESKNSIENILQLYHINNIPLGFPLKNTKLLLIYNDNNEKKEKFLEINENHIYYEKEEKSYLLPKILSSYDCFGSYLIDDQNWIIGELWIGGSRQCWIDVNENYKCGEYIYTGDIIAFNKNDKNLYYYGRTNQQVKLSGYRIYLEQCNNALENLSVIKKAVTLLINNNHFDELVSFITCNEPLSENNPKSLISSIKNNLKNLLPFYSIPNQIYILKEFPLNKNGKIDIKQLQRYNYDKFEDQNKNDHNNINNNNNNNNNNNALNFRTIIRQYDKQEILSVIQKNIYQILIDINPKYKLNFNDETGKKFFFEMGGNSIEATVFANKMNKIINNNNEENYIKELSLYIMNYSLDEVTNKIYQLICNINKDNDNIKNNNNNNLIKTNEITKNDNNLINNNYHNKNNINNNENKIFIGFISKAQSLILNNSSINDESIKVVHELEKFKNQIKFDFKKCIDASPTVSISKIINKNNHKLEYTCFIGSHSSLFISININKKIINWQVSLHNRIEGSACISLCGKYVIVGCYDGCLYVLSVNNGEIFWQFKTEDIIKCTPVVDTINGHIWFGGYDNILYELDIYSKQIISKFKTHGSIFASPAIDIKKSIIYCCNLKGELYSININKNNTNIYNYNWKFNITDNKPIFTTPRLSYDGLNIYFGCVDGYVYCINTLNGKPIWKFNTNGPIFSSPCLFNNDKNLVIGSHSNYIFCLNINNKEIFNNNNNINNNNNYSEIKIIEKYEWKIKTNKPVFATPYFMSDYNNKKGETENWIYVVDIDGHLYNIQLNFNKRNDDKSRSKIQNDHLFDINEHINKKIKLTPKELSNIKNDGEDLNKLENFSIIKGNENNITIVSINKIKLSGPIFSSPIIINNKILLIGSRDNNLYILE